MANYKFIGNPKEYSSDYDFVVGSYYSDNWTDSKKQFKTVGELAKEYPLDFELFSCKSQAELSEISLRYNSGKPRWSLIHYPSLLPLVKVLEHGCVKYSRDNWKKGLNKKELLESTMRHLVELMEDNEDDSESKLAHTGHIMANIMFYEYHKNNNSFTQDK